MHRRSSAMLPPEERAEIEKRRAWRRIGVAIMVLLLALGLAAVSLIEDQVSVKRYRVVEASGVVDIPISDILGEDTGTVVNGTVTITCTSCPKPVDAFIAHTSGDTSNTTIEEGSPASMSFTDAQDVLTIVPRRSSTLNVSIEATIVHRRFSALAILSLALFVAGTAYALYALMEYMSSLALSMKK